MAVKLVLEFRDAEAATRKWSFSNADADVEVSSVKALMNGMITNGSIYKYPPKTIVGAQVVVTTTEDLKVTN